MANAVRDFQKGYVKRTNYQLKKHITQMDRRDLQILFAELRTIQKLNRSTHLKNKLDRKETVLNVEDIYETLHSEYILHSIIEYNETYNEPSNRVEQRVLIRLNKMRAINIANKGTISCFTFVVINLTKKEITTCYLNDATDKHETIQMDRYNPDMRVRYVVKGGINPKSWQGKGGPK